MFLERERSKSARYERLVSALGIKAPWLEGYRQKLIYKTNVCVSAPTFQFA